VGEIGGVGEAEVLRDVSDGKPGIGQQFPGLFIANPVDQALLGGSLLPESSLHGANAVACHQGYPFDRRNHRTEPRPDQLADRLD
jgi:hypothetical protein